jgi:beta-xylosidase
VVFELTRESTGKWSEHVLYRFTGFPDGSNPRASLIFDGDGSLYGTTFLGGTIYDTGVVFELTRASTGAWSEHVLHRFTGGTDGGRPEAELIFDAAGNLYGTADVGGGTACYGYSGCGLVFELTRESTGKWSEHVLHRFTGGLDGDEPDAGLIFDAAGNLYGAATHTGEGNEGLVFKLTRTSTGTWSKQVLHRFDAPTDGGFPFRHLVFGADGNLYGTTTDFCGMFCAVVYQITP